MPLAVDPHAWILALPLALGLVALWFQPRDHVVKRIWSDLARSEAEVWLRLSGRPARVGPAPAEAALYWAAVAALAAGSALSLATFLA